jgi:ribose transport system substrate-binding protein
MSVFLRVSAIVALAAVLACVPACSSKSNRITIGVVTNCTDTFWSFCEAGAKKAAEEEGVDLQFRQLAKAFDASEQNQIVDNWVNQGLNGIAVSVIDPTNQKENLTRVAKQLPMIAMDNDAPGTGRLMYIGIDNYEAGKAAGRLVKKALPQGGTVGVFIGDTKSANGKARTQGVLDELAGAKDATGGDLMPHPQKPSLQVRKFGNFYLVDGKAQEDKDPNMAQATAGPVLERVQGLPNLCMVGLYAYNPPAIMEEANAKKMINQVKIIGFDEAWVTLQGIREGKIEATVVQDPFRYGYESVKALAEKAKGKEYKPEPIYYRIVTKTGGEKEMVDTPAGKIPVENLPVDEFEKKLRADLDSVKK